MLRPRLLATATAIAAGIAWSPRPSNAQSCRVIEVDMVPTGGLQIAAWLEDAQGNYVDTLFVTHTTGKYGLGNRSGVMDMKGGPLWPYGPRLDVLPVWAHAHGIEFPLVMFQNGDGSPGTRLDDSDRNLSHPGSDSSTERYYCAPLHPESEAWDTGTCATPNQTNVIFTDKGQLSPDLVSVYPPRADHDPTRYEPNIDHPSVLMFDELNPFDEISRATPAGDLPFAFSWMMPGELPSGAYVLRVEVSKEFDFNDSHDEHAYPPIAMMWYSEYGMPYHGQPSVVYDVPFEIANNEARASTDAYAGYGDPTGIDGELRPPDATITAGTPGSGADRLALVVDATGAYRVRVIARPELDPVRPGAITDLHAARVDQRSADIAFVAPGDDDVVGTVVGYDVVYRIDGPVTADNFASSTELDTEIVPDEPGQIQTFALTRLLPRTTYHVGVRAYDDCRNYSEIATLELTTDDRTGGEVDACFVATAAYGSAMAGDVAALRRWRDDVLRATVLGELAVEAYYTFGPALAGVIGESELLRDTARASLAPVVERVR